VIYQLADMLSGLESNPNLRRGRPRYGNIEVTNGYATPTIPQARYLAVQTPIATPPWGDQRADAGVRQLIGTHQSDDTFSPPENTLNPADHTEGNGGK